MSSTSSHRDGAATVVSVVNTLDRRCVLLTTPPTSCGDDFSGSRVWDSKITVKGISLWNVDANDWICATARRPPRVLSLVDLVRPMTVCHTTLSVQFCAQRDGHEATRRAGFFTARRYASTVCAMGPSLSASTDTVFRRWLSFLSYS